MLEISPVNENTWIVYFGETISDEVAMRVKHFNDLLWLSHAEVVLDTVPSYTSVLVTFNLRLIDRFAMAAILRQAYQRTISTELVDQALETLVIEVCYGIGAVNDLEYVAQYCGLTTQQIIDLHAGQSYRVYAIGFSPGFGFLGNTHKSLFVPRRKTPRLKIPAGSVSLADNQSAVYPSESPGGWQVIGRTWQKMVDWDSDEFAFLKTGYKVRFEPISEADYRAKGGQL
jgi:inhibitor of KinA